MEPDPEPTAPAGSIPVPGAVQARAPVAAARRPLPPPRVPAASAVAPNATIVGREAVSATVVRFRVRPDDGVPAFEPGQYLAVGLPVDGRLLQRPYSTASPRGEDDALEFLVRLVSTGALTPRLWQLGIGSRVRMGRPKGRFTACADDHRRPVYVATGTGIAPLISMLDSRLREAAEVPRSQRPIVVHGVAHASDLAYRGLLAGHAGRGRIAYVPVVSRPADPANAGWAGATGHVDALLPALLAEHRVDPSAAVAFICGNPAMTEAAGGVLRGLGLPPEAVRSEAYWGPTTFA